MRSYWKNHYDSISKQFPDSLLKQVGKTINGKEISEKQVKLIVKNLANVLSLSAKDSVIDLCCGNGIITRHIAPHVDNVLGIDFTKGLIESAIRYNGLPNITYMIYDVLRLDIKYFLGKKKIIMYEALQHFSKEQFLRLMGKLNRLYSSSLVFLGSIPNSVKLKEYYDTQEKYQFYLRCKREGKPHMGRWWSVDEIECIAAMHGFKITPLAQDPMLYTAYYRFDVLLERCQ